MPPIGIPAHIWHFGSLKNLKSGCLGATNRSLCRTSFLYSIFSLRVPSEPPATVASTGTCRVTGGPPELAEAFVFRFWCADPDENLHSLWMSSHPVATLRRYTKHLGCHPRRKRFALDRNMILLPRSPSWRQKSVSSASRAKEVTCKIPKRYSNNKLYTQKYLTSVGRFPFGPGKF